MLNVCGDYFDKTNNYQEISKLWTKLFSISTKWLNNIFRYENKDAK